MKYNKKIKYCLYCKYPLTKQGVTLHTSSCYRKYHLSLVRGTNPADKYLCDQLKYSFMGDSDYEAYL